LLVYYCLLSYITALSLFVTEYLHNIWYYSLYIMVIFAIRLVTLNMLKIFCDFISTVFPLFLLASLNYKYAFLFYSFYTLEIQVSFLQFYFTWLVFFMSFFFFFLVHLSLLFRWVDHLYFKWNVQIVYIDLIIMV
jgi:hypothetical protein